jgi:hypothetical protein
LVVLNAGGLDCELPASPKLELRDAKGILLASTKPISESPSAVMLPTNWAAVAPIAFADWCLSTPTLPLQLNLVIGTTGVDVTALGQIWPPACMSSPESLSPVFTYGSPLTIPGTPTPPVPDPCDHLPVAITLSQPPKIHPGDTLTYTVAITNRSAYQKPLDLAGECPNYNETLFLPGSGQTIKVELALNMLPTTFLAAGERATLEMRVPIPADAATGTATIVWQIGARGPAAKATFEVGPS